MFEGKEVIKVIDKLIELTQHSKIIWRQSDQLPQTTDPNPNNSLMGLVYLTNYLNKNIRVYNHRYRYFYDDENYIWEDKVVIEFVDDYGNLLATLPYSPNTDELFKAIQFQYLNFKDFYTNLFQK